MRASTSLLLVGLGLLVALGSSQPASAQTTSCEIPREALDIWRCENGFVIGPENIIIRLPIPETDPEALYRAGLEAAQREDWHAAIAYFTAAHQRAHLVPRYMYNLGLAHARAGNEGAAIGWLTAYLVAAPQATNRSDVWSQIATLESAARQKIDVIWTSASAAVLELPTTPYSAFSGSGTPRSAGYGSLAYVAAAALDWDRFRAFTAQSRAAITYGPNDTPRPIEADMPSARAGALASALNIYDLETANNHADALPAPDQSDDYDRRGALQSLREGSRPRLEWHWGSSLRRGRTLEAFDRGDRRAFMTLGADGEGEDRVILAREGRDREALAAIRTGPPPSNWLGDVSRGIRAFQVGEASLLVGNVQGATRALALARQYIPNSRPEDYDGIIRLEALILAERGETERALATLEAVASRNNAAGIYSDDRNRCCIGLGAARAPGHQWSEYRYYPAAQIVRFLFFRGRVGEAVPLSERLDTIRRIALLNYGLRVAQSEPDRNAIQHALATAERVASGGSGFTAEQRQHIEDAIITARRLPGVAYDLEGAIRTISRNSSAVEQVINLALPAKELQLALRMARISYQRTGGTWGQ